MSVSDEKKFKQKKSVGLNRTSRQVLHQRPSWMKDKGFWTGTGMADWIATDIYLCHMPSMDPSKSCYKSYLRIKSTEFSLYGKSD